MCHGIIAIMRKRKKKIQRPTRLQMENRFSFLTKEKGQWCALRYYGIRKCISYSATDQDKNRDKLAQRQKCFKRSTYFFIPIKFWLFLSEIKIFLIITFKLSMKLFVHKIYYTQDDDSLFWQSPMNQTVPRILFSF